MSQALTTIDPRWLEVLRKIPVNLVDPRDYPRVIFALEGVAQCKSWSDICLPGLSKPEWAMLKRRSPEFLALAKEAEGIAADIRHMEREQEAHDRAVKGEQTPTVDKAGNIVDWYPKRSDRLLELLLKAADPKYREPKSEGQGAGRVVLNVNFAIPSRVPQTAVIEGEIVDDHKEVAGAAEAGSAGENGPAAPGTEPAGPVAPA
jgi:hypothetical protein